MQRRLIVDCNFLSGFNVAQGDEEDVAVGDLHEGVGLTGMIDVVGAISPATAVQAPAFVDRANPQPFASRPPISLGVGDSFAGILRYLSPASKGRFSETASAFNSGFLDRETRGQF